MENLSTALGNFLETYGLLAIFVVMLLKEGGIPIPIPSDLIMITAGVQAATGVYTLVELTIAILVAIFVGGSIQFLLTRSAGRQVIYRMGRYVGLTPERLDKALALLERRGTLAVFLGLNVPGARAGIIPAAGLARLAYAGFAPSMLGGSGVFYGWHIALGYLVGPSAEALLRSIPIVPILVGLSLLGLVVWFVLRRRKRQQASVIDTLHSWTHAACPACLTITVIQQMREEEVHV
jgi:membrane protein DedA with SNARE-associated domain